MVQMSNSLIRENSFNIKMLETIYYIKIHVNNCIFFTFFFKG